MSKTDFERIKFEELEDRFEMEAAGGSCERKCSGGDGGNGGDGGGNGGNGGNGGTIEANPDIEVKPDINPGGGTGSNPSLGTIKDELDLLNP